MISSPDPSTSVERFAELSAMLDDPFAERAVVLLAVGLDDTAWTQLNDLWLARFREPAGESLALRFAKTFASTRRRLAGEEPARKLAELTEPKTGEPRFLSEQAQPWRADAAHVGEVASPAPPLLAGAPRPSPPPPSQPSAAPSGHPLGGTVDTGRSAVLPPLPFAMPPAAVVVTTAAAPERFRHPLAGTADVDARSLHGDALPFSPVPPVVAHAAPGDLSGTLPLGEFPAELWPFPSNVPPKPKP